MRWDPSGARLRGARAGGGLREERGASVPGTLCWGAQSGEEGVVESGGSSREGRGAQVSGTLCWGTQSGKGGGGESRGGSANFTLVLVWRI